MKHRCFVSVFDMHYAGKKRPADILIKHPPILFFRKTSYSENFCFQKHL